jgi:hypothetical protein
MADRTILDNGHVRIDRIDVPPLGHEPAATYYQIEDLDEPTHVLLDVFQWSAIVNACRTGNVL